MDVSSHTGSVAADVSNSSGLAPPKKQTKLAAILNRISPSKKIYPANTQQASASVESVDTIDELKEQQETDQSAGKSPSHPTHTLLGDYKRS